MATDVPAEPLREIFAALTGQPTSRVLWDGEPIPFVGPTEAEGKTGLIVLNVVATRTIGVDQETVTYPEDPDAPDATALVELSGHRVRTISVRAESFEAEGFNLLEDLRMRLASDAVGEQFNACGMSFDSTSDVRSLDVSIGTRAVSFAQFDVFLNQRVSLTLPSDATFIEDVEVTGEGDLELAGTDLIES